MKINCVCDAQNSQECPEISLFYVSLQLIIHSYSLSKSSLEGHCSVPSLLFLYLLYCISGRLSILYQACISSFLQRYPQPRGQKKKKVVKYGMGGMIVVLLICIVWFPLLFMSLVKSVAGVVNPPLDVSFEITLAGFQVFFLIKSITANDNNEFCLLWSKSFFDSFYGQSLICLLLFSSEGRERDITF